MSYVRMIGALVAASALVSSASTSFAQSGNPWTGFYLGVHGGYGTVKDANPSVNGGLGGIQGGYNWKFNQIVVGVEGDYTFSGLNAQKSVAIPGIGVAKLEAGIDSLWSVRARLGFLAMNNLLVYGTVGYGGFEMAASATLGAISVSETARAAGLVAGGGVEYGFTRNITGRLEGLYYMGKGSGIASGAEPEITAIRAGLSYRF